MNCEEVVGILDNERIDRLDAGRRRQVDAHVAVCADCAGAWNLQAGLASLPDMALPADFAARCRALVAAGVRPAAKGSRTSRVRLVGMLATLAAALAVVAFLLWPASSAPPDHLMRLVETPAIATAPDSVSGGTPAGVITPVAMDVPAAPTFTVRVELPDEAAIEAREAQMSPALRDAVRAERRVIASNPSRGQAVQSLYVALFDELRKVPGLKLLQSDPAELPASARHYKLRVSADAVQTMSGAVVRGDGHSIPVELVAQQVQPGGKNIHRAFVDAVVDLLAACSGTEAVDPACPDPRGTAAALVLKLRQDVFPADSSVTAPLQAKFRDASLDTAQRAKALEELYQLQLRVGSNGPLRDPGVLRSALELAASADPVLRAQIWRSLRGVGSADLIQPLLASLLQDPDDVRLAALETLSADFLGDPRVRSALETVALGDARPLIRAVAERGLSGEEAWRRYVTASLKNRDSPAAQRVEALVYYLYPPGPTERTSRDNPDYEQIMKDMLDDDAALRAFAEAIPDAGRLRGGNGGLLLMSNVGYRYARNPATTEMMLRILQSDPVARRRTVAGEVLARAHASEPRVRDALNKALNSDPDQSVRNWIRLILAEQPQP
jgi:hypothetical protein